jgi:hypothetical protein
MARKIPTIGINVGLKRVPKASSTYQAAFTRSTRESMAAIIENYRSLVNAIRDATPQILHDIMEPVFDLSQLYCPVKTGKLQDSGRISAHETGTRVRVDISYGDGANVPYAAIVHERTELAHAPPTRSKYLQAALEESLDDIKEGIVQAYGDIINKGGGRML